MRFIRWKLTVLVHGSLYSMIADATVGMSSTKLGIEKDQNPVKTCLVVLAT